LNYLVSTIPLLYKKNKELENTNIKNLIRLNELETKNKELEEKMNIQ
jgi:hypothetical protein